MTQQRYNPLKNLMQLNPEETASFRAIAEGVRYRKVTSGGYIDLTVEMVEYRKIAGVQAMDYSFCHYGELNGDLMRDPEMLFLVIVSPDGDWHVYPHYYRNDYAYGYETESLVPKDGGMGVLLKTQHDQASFAQDWLRNLKEQGFVANAGKQAVKTKLGEEEE